MRQLAEISVESQTKAFEVIRKRAEENLKTLFDRSGGGSGSDSENG